MIVQWTPDLAVGYVEIDNQHKELYRRVDALIESMESGESREQADQLLSFLEKYVVSHFRSEERLMKMKEYPEAAAHIREHKDFIEVFVELRAEYETSGPSHALSLKLQKVVIGWLNGHISKTDKALATFVSG